MEEIKNISNLKSTACTGCSACNVACPKSAIKMIVNEYGFFQATIDNGNCINCGICLNVCPVNKKYSIIQPVLAQAAQSTDDAIIKESSSGGIAHELASYYIKNGYYVVGSYFDISENHVKSIVTNKSEDLYLLKKSKYLQSDFSIGFKMAIDIARKDNNIKFLVFATPCQIAAASEICKFYAIRDRFIFVDFFCHGVPSYLVWNKFLCDKKINANNLKYATFRSKDQGWHSCFKILVADDTKEIKEKSISSDFYNAFFDNVFFMESCYECQFRKGASQADIRLGDYWGKKYLSNNNGVSAIFVLTEKGREILSKLSSIKILDNASPSDILKSQSTEDYFQKKFRTKSFEILRKSNSLHKAIKKYRKLFPLKIRIKLKIKNIVGYILPNKIINFLKRFV